MHTDRRSIAQCLADQELEELRTLNTVQYIARMVVELSPADREQLLTETLPELMCMHCGKLRAPVGLLQCRCWGDE